MLARKMEIILAVRVERSEQIEEVFLFFFFKKKCFNVDKLLWDVLEEMEKMKESEELEITCFLYEYVSINC